MKYILTATLIALGIVGARAELRFDSAVTSHNLSVINLVYEQAPTLFRIDECKLINGNRELELHDGPNVYKDGTAYYTLIYKQPFERKDSKLTITLGDGKVCTFEIKADQIRSLEDNSNPSSDLSPIEP